MRRFNQINWVRFSRALAVTVALAASTDAHGHDLSMSWRSCFAPLTTHEQVSPGGGFYTLSVSVAGQGLHHGYEVRLRVTSPDGDGALPDAWRFDAAGCQLPTAFEGFTYVPVFTRCSELAGAVQRTEALTYEYEPETASALITMRVVYGASHTPAASARPRIAAYIRFHHGDSQVGPTVEGESCGGLERAVCIEDAGSGYLDDSLTLWPWSDGSVFATASTSSTPPEGCPPVVPVKRQSWGSTKVHYRN